MVRRRSRRGKPPDFLGVLDKVRRDCGCANVDLGLGQEAGRQAGEDPDQDMGGRAVAAVLQSHP